MERHNMPLDRKTEYHENVSRNSEILEIELVGQVIHIFKFFIVKATMSSKLQSTISPKIS